MSLILDALNRSQRERDNQGSVPGLETVHPVETISGSKKLFFGLAAIFLSAVAITAIWQFRSSGGESVGQGATIATPVALATASLAGHIPEHSDPIARPSVPSTRVPSKTPADSPTPNAVNTPTTGAIAALYREPKPIVGEVNEAALETNNPPAGKLAPSTPLSSPQEHIDINEVLNRTRAGLGNAKLQEHSAPFLAELSQQMKDSIPTLYYSVHDYSSTASRSSVVLNGERKSAGQSLGGPLRLEEILADSVVLSIRGTQFRLKALNSWVNL